MHKVFTPRQIQDLVGVNKMMARFGFWLMQLNKINKIYDKLHPAEGIELAEKGIDILNLKLEIDDVKMNTIPEKGPFITLSNHPFGFIDGLSMLFLIGRKRPGVKSTANFLMQQVTPLSKYFISVNPFEGSLYKSMGGTKVALDHLQSGEPLILFPSGQVSTYQNGKLTETEWKPAVINLIKNARVPVYPFFFHGQNSRFFHFLGKIHPILRTIRLPAEFINKKNATIRISMGNVISVKEQDEITNLEEYGGFLRARLYDLQD